MQILTIKRPNGGKPQTGLKVYGTILGDSGVEYKFGYFRRPNFRGWLCACPNFVLSMFGKHKHCKHIDFVQAEYGRYGAAVSPSKQKLESLAPVVFAAAGESGLQPGTQGLDSIGQ